MKQFSRKIVFVALLGFGAIGLALFFNSYTKDFFQKNSAILTSLHTLQTYETLLDYEVLESSFFLYKNLDSFMQTQKDIEKQLQFLKNIYFRKHHPKIFHIVLQYQNSIEKKIGYIYEFASFNSLIKNSTIYLATILTRIYDFPTLSKEYKKLVIDTISSILLAKNSFDKDYLQDIVTNYKQLSAYQFTNKKIEQFHNVLVANLRIFTESFPYYTEYLHKILHSPSKKILKKAIASFIASTDHEIARLNIIYFLLIGLYIFSLGLIVYLMYVIDKENRILKRLKKQLEIQAISDPLTGLFNRKAFEQHAEFIHKPFFALVNIQNFKQYNDFYGTKMGDYILQETAHYLRSIVDTRLHPAFYRIGGDDFGILIEERTPIDAEAFGKYIYDAFVKKKFVYKNIELSITVNIGLTRQRPLLETADMALKTVRNIITRHYMLYKENFGFFEKIEQNIQKSIILQKALQEHNIVPFFQPIIDNTTGKIVKYEALARLKRDGLYESIFSYLPIAKEMKRYEDISKVVIEQSFAKAKKCKKSISVNISMSDVENNTTLHFFGELFERYHDILPLITFEILESEALQDYEAIKNFISIVKAKGCSIAIDDFGSGYSNFIHILKLDIDFIKIDGSLIKDIHKDKTAQIIVKSIIDIAKEAGIITIAEFVHSKEVYKKVQELGIDYSQGFYLAKPQPTF